MKKVAAYLAIVVVALFGAIRAEQAQNRSDQARERADAAQKLARQVDLNGDRSLCKSENRIRKLSNQRDKSLEDTAALVKDALQVIASEDRPAGDRTNIELRIIAKKAQKIRTNFAPEKLSDCEIRFPKEK